MSDVVGEGAPLSWGELAMWFGVVALVTLFVHPFLGVVVALILDCTRLRRSSRAVRVGLVVFAAAIVAFQLVALHGTQTSWTTGPAVPVSR